MDLDIAFADFFGVMWDFLYRHVVTTEVYRCHGNWVKLSIYPAKI